MFATKLMNPSSETENKLRWTGFVKGTPFHFYIPKKCVPEPWPVQIIVQITTVEPGNAIIFHQRRNPLKPITAYVKFDRLHTQTARYSPEGDFDEWEIGQPYIPLTVIDSISPGKNPDRLRIEIFWDCKASTWKL